MSENISILEGNITRKFSPVDKLIIDQTGGGATVWVTEDEAQFDSLSVSDNGVYYAVDDEVLGYSDITVNIPEDLSDMSNKTKTITGHDDDSGNDMEVGLDDEGNLTKEFLPPKIKIVVLPAKRKYHDGDEINYTGIHVYALDGNNHPFTSEDYPTGEIPFSELVFPTTIADAESVMTYGVATLDGETVCYAHTATMTSKRSSEPQTDLSASSSDYLVAVSTNPDSKPLLAISLTQGVAGRSSYSINGSDQHVFHGETKKSYEINGETKYFYSAACVISYYSYSEDQESYTHSLPTSEMTVEDAARIIFEGNLSDESGKQTIPVQWMRTDGEILEDTFEITVGEEGGGYDPAPTTDPYERSYDVESGGHHYNINRSIVPEVHYANGYLWQEGTTEYTVEQAVEFGWLIRLGDM